MSVADEAAAVVLAHSAQAAAAAGPVASAVAVVVAAAASIVASAFGVSAASPYPELVVLAVSSYLGPSASWLPGTVTVTWAKLQEGKDHSASDP